MGIPSFFIGDKVSFVGNILSEELKFYNDYLPNSIAEGYISGRDDLHPERVNVTWLGGHITSCHESNLKLIPNDQNINSRMILQKSIS